MARDALSSKIEEAVLVHLAENGSFSTPEIHEAMTGKDRKYRQLFKRLMKDYPEYPIALAYEKYLMERVGDFTHRRDSNGDRIFIGIPVTGSKLKRYIMRMDATPDQLEKAGFSVLALGFATLQRGVESVVAANALDVLGENSLRATGEDYATINDRIKSDAEATVTKYAAHLNGAVTSGVTRPKIG